MNKIIGAVKVIILNIQIKRCELKIIKSKARSNELQSIIINNIIKGTDELEIEKLKLTKKWTYEKRIKMLDRKFDLQRKLSRAS